MSFCPTRKYFRSYFIFCPIDDKLWLQIFIRRKVYTRSARPVLKLQPPYSKHMIWIFSKKLKLNLKKKTAQARSDRTECVCYRQGQIIEYPSIPFRSDVQFFFYFLQAHTADRRFYYIFGLTRSIIILYCDSRNVIGKKTGFLSTSGSVHRRFTPTVRLLNYTFI